MLYRITHRNGLEIPIAVCATLLVLGICLLAWINFRLSMQETLLLAVVFMLLAVVALLEDIRRILSEQ